MAAAWRSSALVNAPSVRTKEISGSMDLIALNTFATVARTGSVSAAANRLHTVQSNVTSRIKMLESEVGTALFERHSRGVTLTDAGQRLLAFADRFSSLQADALAAVRDDGAVHGELRIGVLETTAAIRLPAVLSKYRGQYPNVDLTIKTGTTAELLEATLARRVDVALVVGPIDHPELAAEAVFSEELVLVNARHAPSIAERLSAGPLCAIMFREGCSYRTRLEACLAAMGFPSLKRLEFGTIEGMLGCVAAGLGVSMTPRSVVERCSYRDELRIETHPLARIPVKTLVIRRLDSYPSAALRSFLRVLPRLSDCPGKSGQACSSDGSLSGLSDAAVNVTAELG